MDLISNRISSFAATNLKRKMKNVADKCCFAVFGGIF